MDPEILDKIRTINREFYQTFADSFSDTRARLQPGVQKLLPSILQSGHVLDLGCGNGTLAAKLHEGGFSGNYLGLDLSEPMLAIARTAIDWPARYEFHPVELGASDLEKNLRTDVPDRFQPPYDHQVAFATLHHIPGKTRRRELALELKKMLARAGRLLLSVWNFMDSARLRERVIPWESIGLSEGQVEPGDYLIDWRRDGRGTRYVHHFSEIELSALADFAGFQIVDSFYSDGETDTLGLYQVWQA